MSAVAAAAFRRVRRERFDERRRRSPAQTAAWAAVSRLADHARSVVSCAPDDARPLLAELTAGPSATDALHIVRALTAVWPSWSVGLRA